MPDPRVRPGIRPGRHLARPALATPGPAGPEPARPSPGPTDFGTTPARRASPRAPRRAARSGPALDGRAAAYDAFAPFYERHWSAGLSAQLWAAAAPLLLPRVPTGGHVLDLCCGTGVAAAALFADGFRVTGVDASAGMLTHARRRAPGARFVAADLRRFALPGGEPPADGAVCLGEGLNHLLTVGDLARALDCVARALVPGAVFVFDAVEERRFAAHWWGQTYETREADRAFAACGTYDPTTRLARMHLEVAWREDPAGCDGAAWDGVSGHGGWRSAERVLLQRCHTPAEVDHALRRAGFAASYVDAARELGLADQAGRVFVVARRADPRRADSRRDGRRQGVCADGHA